MGSTVVLRSVVEGDAEALAATIAAAFEQYRGRLIPESGAFRESADRIARELADGTGPRQPQSSAEGCGQR
jgi:hypothetical protein